MITKHLNNVEAEIRQAVQRLGYADCSVTPQTISDHPGNLNSVGKWYVLAVTYRDGMQPEVWGRRRTMAELLHLAQRGPLTLT